MIFVSVTDDYGPGDYHAGLNYCPALDGHYNPITKGQKVIVRFSLIKDLTTRLFQTRPTGLAIRKSTIADNQDPITELCESFIVCGDKDNGATAT